MTISIAALAVALLASPAVWWLLNRPTVLRSRLRHRVIVTLHSGAVFDGILHSADAHAWVLREAHAVGDRGVNVSVDGEVIVLAADIEYAQRP